MSDDLVERLNVVLATLERGDILMIAQEDDCRWIRDAKAEIERLRAALVEARDDVGSWGAYAPPYFQEKWDLEGNIARIDAALSPLPRRT